jgi:hypothetical protein
VSCDRNKVRSGRKNLIGIPPMECEAMFLM